jgi:RNA recognition motif-containing protein
MRVYFNIDLWYLIYHFLLKELTLNIYVGNLPKKTTDEAVKKLFESYGEVTEVKLIKDQFSGELKGFGFVTMPTKTDAQKAINEVNGKELEGRALIVNEARPRKEKTNSGGGSGRYRSNSGGGGFQGGGRSRY